MLEPLEKSQVLKEIPEYLTLPTKELSPFSPSHTSVPDLPKILSKEINRAKLT